MRLLIKQQHQLARHKEHMPDHVGWHSASSIEEVWYRASAMRETPAWWCDARQLNKMADALLTDPGHGSVTSLEVLLLTTHLDGLLKARICSLHVLERHASPRDALLIRHECG